jgi:threonine dehydratase
LWRRHFASNLVRMRDLRTAGLINAAQQQCAEPIFLYMKTTRRLSLQRIDDAAGEIDDVFRETPQFQCEPLSARLGCALTLKVETLNPIRSFKGRGASFLVSELLRGGQRPTLVCGSAGNFGQALAYACRRHGLRLIVYAAHSANALKVERMRALGAEVRIDGEDFDAAKAAARDWAEANDARLVVDGREPAISEGAGTIARELLAHGNRFDAILVPLGNGALINGIALWTKAVWPTTRIIGVCSSGARAMAESFYSGTPQTRDSRTLCDGIAVRVPIPESLADMTGLVDDVLCVDDLSTLEAMRLLHRHAGLVIEPAGAIGVAALLSAAHPFLGSNVATVLCGGNLTPEQVQAWLGSTLPSAQEHHP